MKTILSLIFILALGFSGCATLKTYTTPDNARAAASLVCSNTITFAVGAGDRVETANYVYAVARAVRTLAGGTVPTPGELRDAIAVFTPNSAKWLQLRSGIAIVYGGLYAKLTRNPKLAAQYLEAIAAGCEDAAGSFISTK